MTNVPLEVAGAATFNGASALLRASGGDAVVAFDGGIVLGGGGVEASNGARVSVASVSATSGLIRTMSEAVVDIAGNFTKTGAGVLVIDTPAVAIEGTLEVGGVLSLAGRTGGTTINVTGGTTLVSGATLRLDMLGAERNVPRLTLVNGVEFDGDSFGDIAIDVVTTNSGVLENATYLLIDAGTTLVNTSRLLLNGVEPAGLVRATNGSAIIGLATTALGQIALSYISAATNTTMRWAGTAVGSGIWRNDDGTPVAESAANWAGTVEGVNVNTFLNGDTVVFTDAATRRDVQVDAAGVRVGPGGISVTTGARYSISGGAIRGSGGLLKAGTGELVLGSANAYSGATDVTGGRLTLHDISGAGTSTSLSLATGTTLRLDIAPEKSGVFAKNITGGGSIEKSSGGTVHVENPFLHTGDTSIAAGRLEVAAPISGTRNVTVTTATLRIRDGGSVTATGNVTFGLAGIFETDTSGIISSGGILAFSGGVGTNANRVDITGYTTSETVEVASATEIRHGNYIVTIAGVEVPTDVSLDAFMNTDVRIEGTAGVRQTLQVKNALVWDNTATGKQHGTFNITGGSSFTIGAAVGQGITLADNLAASGGTGFANWDGRSLTKQGAGELVLATTNNYTGTTSVEAGRLTLRTVSSAGTSPAGISVAADAVLAFDIAAENSGGVFTKSVSGAGELVKTGAGEVALASANTHTGGTRVEAGTLTLRNISATGTAPEIAVNSGATLRFDTGSASWQFTKEISGAGDLVKAGSGTLILSIESERSGATHVEAGTLTLRDIDAVGTDAGVSVDAGASLNIDTGAGEIWEWNKEITGAGNLVKSGQGELILSRASSYTGDTHLTGGTLVALNFESTGTSAGATLRLEAGTSLRLDLDESSGGVFQKQITGAGDLVKEGVGELVLTRANSYNGGTIVAAGSLVIRNVGGVGTGDLVSVASGASFTFDVAETSDNWTFQRRVTGAGEIVKSGAGALALAGANDYTGVTRVTGGVLAIEGPLGSGNAAGGATHNAAIRLEGGDLVLRQTSDQVLAGAISGSGSLFKSGSGALTLTAANTYAGTTTVGSGVLTLTGTIGASAIGGSANYASNIFLNGGDLVLNQSGRQTLSGIISGSGSVTKTGSGVLLLTGAIAHTGGTTIQNGTLQIGTTHGLDGSRPQTLNLPTVTVHAGATLAFDIIGDNLSDKLFTSSVAFADINSPEDAITIDISKLANGAYILIENTTGFDLTSGSPDALFNTLVNGAPIEADSPLQAHYAYSADGRNLVLQITGASDGGEGGDGGTTPPDTTIARSVTWTGDGDTVGVWDVYATNWTRPASNGGPAYADSFRQGDTVRFQSSSIASQEINIGGAMRVTAMNVAGGGDFRFTNGSIRGVVDSSIEGGTGALVKEGSSRLAFRDTSLAFDGGVTVKEGILAIETNTLNAAVKIEAGGRLVLGSSADEGISELGTKGVIGRINGNVTNQGQISGNGIIQGTFVNKGTISPGFSAGVIEINGSFDNSQGVIALQIEADGSHDIIRHAGTEELVIGGKITLDISPQYIADHVEGGRIILPALLETVSGAGEVSLDEEIGLILTDPTLYGRIIDFSNGIAQIGRDFRSLPSLRAELWDFATVLNSISADAAADPIRGDVRLLDAILALTDEAQLTTAIRNASPIGLAGMTALALTNASGDLNAVREHLDDWRIGSRDKFESGLSTYFRVNGNFADNGSGASSPVFDTNSYGASVGLDYLSSSPFAAGVNLSGNIGRATLHDDAGRVTQEQFRFTGYFSTHLAAGVFADVLLSGGYSEYESRRNTLTGQNKGDTDGSDLAVALYFAKSFAFSPEWGLKPFAGIEYATARVSSYSENDTGAGALAIDSFSQDSLRLKLGTSANYFVKTGADRRDLRLSLNIAYAYELQDTDTDITAAFIGGDGSKFTVKAPSTPENVLQIGPSASLTLPGFKDAAVQFGYTFETDFKHRTAHQLNAAFRLRF
ncbi:MAG: autotransporter-associated beta strand repeat-containing protein [Puniceicoccales bacterium]|nr:autotransporter-associated beta strand repeat-containing protein [Puniceicoccales bacterium]